MIGRVHLLCGQMDEATAHIEESIALTKRERWLSFLPWPQAILGEVEIVGGDAERGENTLKQAFARACQLGDPCWEGVSGRGLALAAEAFGRSEEALAVLADARLRCNRFADSYVWLDVYILDAQCELGLRYHHPETKRWAEEMHHLAARTGMRELTARALLYLGELGAEESRGAAVLARAGIENPALDDRFRKTHTP